MPLDHALELRIPWWGQLDLRGQRAGERRRRDADLPAAADRRLPVPQQGGGHPADAVDQRPHARQDVPGLAGGDHHRGHEPGERQRHHQHRQHPLLPLPDRDPRLGKPQIALGELAGLVGHPVHRIDTDVLRADTRQQFLQRPFGVRPADPLRDHRRRHLRPLPQKRPDLRLVGIGHLAAPGPLVLRRPVRGQRRPHRVTGHAQPPGDLLDGHALRPMQTANLGPVLHFQHPPKSRRGVSFRSTPRGQFSGSPDNSSRPRSDAPTGSLDAVLPCRDSPVEPHSCPPVRAHPRPPRRAAQPVATPEPRAAGAAGTGSPA